MSFNLRHYLEWETPGTSQTARAAIMQWTEQEPSASMRLARPPRGHRWLWELLDLFAPHSMPDKARCRDITAFSAPNEARFLAGHKAWLQQNRPPGVDLLHVLLNDNLFETTWDEYVQQFAPLAHRCLACTPDLRWMALGYFDEFIVGFRPRWDAIESVTSVSKRRKSDGSLADDERIVLRLHDATMWESGQVGHPTDAATLAMLAGVVSGITGITIEKRELSPWETGPRA